MYIYMVYCLTIMTNLEMETICEFKQQNLESTEKNNMLSLLIYTALLLLLLLLSRFSRVWLCATSEMAAQQAPPSLGFSRQEHWSGLPFPSPMHASEKWKWSRSVVSDPQRPHGLQPTRLLRPWDFPGKSTGVGCHSIHQSYFWVYTQKNWK